VVLGEGGPRGVEPVRFDESNKFLWRNWADLYRIAYEAA
jgi:hypothetical protein